MSDERRYEFQLPVFEQGEDILVWGDTDAVVERGGG